MNGIILKLAMRKTVTDDDLSDALYDICDSVHASCDSECPVFAINGNAVPDSAKDFEVNRGCDCFKSGDAMLAFIRSHA